MLVRKSKYTKAINDLKGLRQDYSQLDEHKGLLIEKVHLLERTIASLNHSNVVPYTKAKDGDLVMHGGHLRRVLKINGNWVLDLNAQGQTLDVRTPLSYDEKFGSGPVSKQDLVSYMKENGYYNG